MQKKDRRIRKTKAQLKAGLAKLMINKSIKEITVKELVDEVDINRSTFYLHYTDIYNMLEVIESELIADIKCLIDTHPIGYNENIRSIFIDLFSIISEDKEIYSAFLGQNGNISFIQKIESIIEENIENSLKKMYPNFIDDLKYSISFCLSGCVGLIKNWLLEFNQETPEHMAELTATIIKNSMKSFYELQSNEKI